MHSRAASLLSLTFPFLSVAGGSECQAASRGGGVRPREESAGRVDETGAAARASTQGASGETGPAGGQPTRAGTGQPQPAGCPRD